MDKASILGLEPINYWKNKDGPVIYIRNWTYVFFILILKAKEKWEVRSENWKALWSIAKESKIPSDFEIPIPISLLSGKWIPQTSPRFPKKKPQAQKININNNLNLALPLPPFQFALQLREFP